MNQLRQRMLEELQGRNFAASTIRTYLHGVAHFSRYFRRPPDQLGPEDIRKYQAMLFTELKYSPNTVILRLASLRGGAPDTALRLVGSNIFSKEAFVFP